MPTLEKTRFAFTKKRLEALPAPIDGRTYFYDTTTPSLCVCVTAAGSKSFYVYKKVDGRPVRYRLGSTDELPLEEARNRTMRYVGKVADGLDPQADRRMKRGEITLGELFAHFLEHHAKPHKKTWKEDEAAFKRYLASWKNWKLSRISRKEVQSLHVRTGDTAGIYAANRLRTLLHTLFAKAVLDFGFDKPNPVVGVKKFHERSRERFLQVDEMQRFWAALEADPSDLCRDFFKVALLTGARRGNVLAMRWEEVNLERATWLIPDTKSGDSLTVVLSPAVVEILSARLANNRAGNEWVFPGHVHGQHLKDPMRPWRAILERAGLSNLRIHDLRRTMGSWQAAAGSSLHIIGKSLGHRRESTTAIYARLDLAPIRESVERATAAMMAIATPTKHKTRKGASNGKA